MRMGGCCTCDWGFESSGRSCSSSLRRVIEIVGVANLVVSTVTAVAAVYLALAALKHTAKPRIIVVRHRPSDHPLRIRSGFDDIFIFDVINVGHWYAKPPARDISIEFQCPWFFKKAELFKGGVGGVLEACAAGGSSDSQITLASRPFTIFAGEKAKFAIEVQWTGFRIQGNGVIVVKAHSSNGATYFHDFHFDFEQ